MVALNHQAPEDWQKAVTVAIHKKGSKKLCKNYGGISLLSIPGKVFAKILDARMHRVTEGQVMGEQAGFRVGRDSWQRRLLRMVKCMLHLLT